MIIPPQKEKGIDIVVHFMNLWHPRLLSTLVAGPASMILQSRFLGKSGTAFVIGGERFGPAPIWSLQLLGPEHAARASGWKLLSGMCC